MNTHYHLILLICFLYLSFVPLRAQGDGSQTVFQHLVDQKITRITIETDFTTLIGEKRKPHRLDGRITFRNERGLEERMDLNVELRGRNRRRVCGMPPLRLDFSKEDLSNRGLREEGDKLKLVTHCMDAYDNEYLLREYWTYRLYNQITPISFQVHLVTIEYVDTAQPDQETPERLAFIIESEEELAARLNREDEKIFGLTPERVDEETYHYNLLFQYMIGNDDWEMANPRNLSFMVSEDKEEHPIVVPYDFDFAGLVNAPYAVPNPNFGAKKVVDRVNLGRPASKEALRQAVDAFLRVQEAQLNCYWDCVWLSKKTKKEMQKYLKGFFKLLNKEKKVEEIFLAAQ